MKKLLVLLCAAALILSMAGVASALLFSETVDFDVDGTYTDILGNTNTYTRLIDRPSGIDNVPYDYTINLGFVGSHITDASLSLAHVGDGIGEVWVTSTAGGILLGNLSWSGFPWLWTTDVWSLGPAVIAEIEGGVPWQLGLRINETTRRTDSLWIAESTLSGNYESSVPEPGTLLLLGVGLVGIAGYGFRRKKRA